MTSLASSTQFLRAPPLTGPGGQPTITPPGVTTFETFSFAFFQADGGERIEFPTSSWKIYGEQRYDVHEYPKTPGGQPEKLGRKPYKVRMVCPFHDVEGLNAFFPDLYPIRLEKLMTLLEAGTTGTLNVPGKGPIRAFGTVWDRDFDTGAPSGETVTFDFLEDSLDLAFGLLQVTQQLGAVGNAAAALAAATTLDATLMNTSVIDPHDFRVGPDGSLQDMGSILSSIAAVSNFFTGLQDQVQLYDAQVAANLDRLIGYCQKLDQTPELDDLRNAQTIQAVLALLVAAQDARADLFAKRIPLRIFPVETGPLSLDEIAIRIYRDATRADDILQLNDFDDAFAIPAGTPVTYYDDGTAVAA
jgi:hypothetical protein